MTATPSSTPPEQPKWPAFPDYQPPAYSPPPVFSPPPDSSTDLPPRGRMSVFRIVTGVLWGAIALICAAGAVGEWLVGIPGGAILCAVIAVGSGWYDYRVWKRKARRLVV
jgi:hypothetical protein